MNVKRENIKNKLLEFYNSSNEQIPTQRTKADWKTDNFMGFLLGVVSFGIPSHRARLYKLLSGNQFAQNEQNFIDSMFDFYIRPFHKNYNTDSESCHTPSNASRPSSRRNSDADYVPEERLLIHNDLKKAVVKRDRVCLFCWDKSECQGAHIIAQKNISVAYDESSLLGRAGLTQKHQVQNGLLLCIKCHSQFDKLLIYVDVVDEKLVVKVVNETNDETSEKHKEWKAMVRNLGAMRIANEEDWKGKDNRLAVDGNGEMVLYFIQNNRTKQPNRNALEFHKAACLIWQMAGGAETDDEVCSDEDELVPVDTAALKRRFKGSAL